jgi:hypothetical protein
MDGRLRKRLFHNNKCLATDHSSNKRPCPRWSEKENTTAKHHPNHPSAIMATKYHPFVTTTTATTRTTSFPLSTIYTPLVPSRRSSSSCGPQQVAGFIKNITMNNFLDQSSQSVELSPRGENVAVLYCPEDNDTKLLLSSKLVLAVQVALGAPLSQLTFQRTPLDQCLAHATTSSNTTATKSQVVLTFWNCGVNAFEPHRYGSQIRVEWSLSPRKNQVLLLLKNSQGKTISKTTEDLHRMLRHFNIRVFDNPAMFMDPSVRHKLLPHSQTTNQSLLYQVFMQASDLEKCVETCAEIEKTLTLLTTSKRSLQADYATKKNKAAALASKLQGLQKNSVGWKNALPELKRNYYLALCKHHHQEYRKDQEVSNKRFHVRHVM